MWFWMSVSVARAATWSLSVEVARVGGELAALDAGTCVPVLEQVYHDLENLRVSEVDPQDLGANGAAVVEGIFGARLTLHERLRAMHEAGTLTDDCVRSIRRADLAGRYLADLVIEALPPERRPPEWLVAPGVDFPSLEEGLRDGDVLVTRGDAVSSAGIAHMGRYDSQFSHNVLIRRMPDGELQTVEAYLELGALTQPLDHLLEHGLGRIVVLRHRDADLAAKAAEAAWTRVAKGKRIGYDADFDFDDHESLFCSEVPRWAFGALIGQPEDVPLSLTVFDHERNHGLFTAMGIETAVTSAPVDVLYDPRFDIVAEWRHVEALPRLRHQDATVEAALGWMEEKGYVLEPSGAERGLVGFALAVRKIPLLGLALKKKIHPKGDKTFLVASLALQNAALPLYEDLEAALAGLPEPILWDTMRTKLEELRVADLERWRQDPKSARYHQLLHPSP